MIQLLNDVVGPVDGVNWGSQVMLEGQPYTLSMFTPLVGDMFRIPSNEGETIAVELVEAAGHADRGQSSPDTGNFAIVFQDVQATADRYLPQGVCRLEHDTMGALDLFLVPIGPGADGPGIRYEAIFTSTDSPP